MHPHQRRFVELALARSALRFGRYTLKSGRESPYFFNAGLFNDGAALAELGHCYADALNASGVEYDMLFGPAYKGIPLVVAVAMAFAERGRDVEFCFNRKEAKDHGEGGSVVGAKLEGRVLIVDDVISAGTAVRESIALIESAGAKAHAGGIALDRQEQGTEVNAQGQARDLPHSAVQYVQQSLGLQVCAIAQLQDLLAFLQLQSSDEWKPHLPAVEAYRRQYGV